MYRPRARRPLYSFSMRSMTGYGSGNVDAPAHQLSLRIEVTSVNRKTLDLNLACPRDWTGLEQKCKDWLKGQFERGRLNITVKAQSVHSESGGPDWNERLMEQTLQRLRNFAEKQDLPLNADGALILKIAQSIENKDQDKLPAWRELEDPLKAAFNQAIEDLNSMRAKEGQALKSDLRARIAELEAVQKEIADHSKGTVGHYRNVLMERLGQLNLELDLADERLLKEVALFADRCDISEELTRLGSHFEQFSSLIESDEPNGRKMDFLCQEVHREFNTIGSKTNQIEVTRAVIDGKNCLERIREQVQNVE